MSPDRVPTIACLSEAISPDTLVIICCACCWQATIISRVCCWQAATMSRVCFCESAIIEDIWHNTSCMAALGFYRHCHLRWRPNIPLLSLMGHANWPPSIWLAGMGTIPSIPPAPPVTCIHWSSPEALLAFSCKGGLGRSVLPPMDTPLECGRPCQAHHGCLCIRAVAECLLDPHN